jgi:glycosyltransferase involved in cell wall biosynthesis
MKISVLMTVYSGSNSYYLDAAIESILNQTYKASEIIIVVNGKIDAECEEVLNKFGNKIKIIKFKNNLGQGHALNTGLEKCSCELVAIHSDYDIAMPDRFDKQVRYFEHNQDVDILGGQILEIHNKTNKVFGVRRVPLKDHEIRAYMRTRCPFNHPTVMFKREKILEIGNYPDIMYMADYALWINAYDLKMANVNDVLAKVRVDNVLFKKKKGFKYIASIRKVEHMLHDRGLIGWTEMKLNILSRSFVALLPNFIRKKIYKHVLRYSK